MPKPIVLMRWPTGFGGPHISEVRTLIQRQLTDYHVMVIPCLPREDFKMKVFYEKDWEEEDIKALEEKIMAEIAKLDQPKDKDNAIS